MKTATLPSIRVEPELREEAEAVLKDGETLSAFMEDSVRRSISRRAMQKEFLARGLQALKDVEEGAETFPADEVHAGLEAMLAKAEREA